MAGGLSGRREDSSDSLKGYGHGILVQICEDGPLRPSYGRHRGRAPVPPRDGHGGRTRSTRGAPASRERGADSGRDAGRRRPRMARLGVPRRTVRAAPGQPDAGAGAGGRAFPGDWHRRQHGDLQPRRRRDPQAPAGPRRGRPAHRRLDERCIPQGCREHQRLFPPYLADPFRGLIDPCLFVSPPGARTDRFSLAHRSRRRGRRCGCPRRRAGRAGEPAVRQQQFLPGLGHFARHRQSVPRRRGSRGRAAGGRREPSVLGAAFWRWPARPGRQSARQWHSYQQCSGPHCRRGADRLLWPPSR